LIVRSPPWTGGPPGNTDPSVLLEVAKHASEGILASLSGTGTDLTEEALEAVGVTPVGSVSNSLNTDGVRDTVFAGTRTIRIKILMHFECKVVLRIIEVLEGVCVDINPGPGSRVAVTFNEDHVCGTGSTDGADTGLVELPNELLIHIVVLVHKIVHDIWRPRDEGGQLVPEVSESSNIRNDSTVISSIIVNVDDSKAAVGNNVADNFVETSQVGLVEWSAETSAWWSNTFHKSWDTESVETVGKEEVNAAW